MLYHTKLYSTLLCSTTLHTTPYTLHTTPYTLHATRYTLHTTPTHDATYSATHNPLESKPRNYSLSMNSPEETPNPRRDSEHTGR